jgi:isopentenyl phosphate kinase
MQKHTAGLDLASEEHRLAVVDGGGRRIEERRVVHTEDGVEALVRRLGELQVARVAVEQPNGIVVDRLLDAGIALVPVHPNQLAAARDRYRLAAASRTASTPTCWPSSPAPTCTACGCSSPTPTRRRRSGR